MTRLAMRVGADVAPRLARYLAVFVVAAVVLSAGFLTGLSSAIGETSIPASGGNEPDPSLQSEAKIRAALHNATTMDFSETPLQDAVDYLRDLHKIEIKLDNKSLEEAGVGSGTPVTFSIRGISLGSALKLMLGSLELTAIVKDGVLLITSPSGADNKIELRVYDVADLVTNDHDAVSDLASLLESMLKPPGPQSPAKPSSPRTRQQPAQSATPLVHGSSASGGGMGGGFGIGIGRGMGGMGCGMGGMGGGMIQQPAGSIKIEPFRKLLLVRAPTADQDELTRFLAEIRDKIRAGK